MEDAGENRETEEMYLERYEECEKDFERNRGSEGDWLDSMTTLRAPNRFYYGQGRYQDVNRYFWEYKVEPEEDEEIGGMQWMLFRDVEEAVRRLLEKGNARDAALIHLDLESRISSTRGCRHFLPGLLYADMAAFCVKTEDPDKAAECVKKASGMMKDG